MRKVLTQEFFNRPALTVTRDLLGKYLVRRHFYSPIRANWRIEKRRKKYKDVAVMITETEAYGGYKDKASQAYKGKTERNSVIFESPGTIYVYFTYGMHFMLNIVTDKKDFPGAVLIRGTDVVTGPARLTKFLKIDKNLNKKILGKKSGLWIEERIEVRGKRKEESGKKKISGKLKIERTPRIGIPRAEEWANKPYRFVLRKC